MFFRILDFVHKISVQKFVIILELKSLLLSTYFNKTRLCDMLLSRIRVNNDRSSVLLIETIFLSYFSWNLFKLDYRKMEKALKRYECTIWKKNKISIFHYYECDAHNINHKIQLHLLKNHLNLRISCYFM